MTTAAHSHKSRKRLTLFIGISLSVLVAFGIRYHAGAAQTIEREEVGGLVFEMSDDDLVGVTIKDKKIRFEQGWNPASENLPKKAQLEQEFSEMKAATQKDYGWDVSSSADRKSILDEANRLDQVLHTIPDSIMKSEEHAALSKLRGVVDMLTGVSKCRGRCLPRAGVDQIFFKVVPFIAIGAAIAAIQAEFFDPSLPKEQVDAAVAALSVGYSVMAFFSAVLITDLFRIQTTKLQNAVMGALFVTLATVHQYKDDAGELAKVRSSTPKDDAKEAAKDISALTPEPDDAPEDYDMVHDEL